MSTEGLWNCELFPETNCYKFGHCVLSLSTSKQAASTVFVYLLFFFSFWGGVGLGGGVGGGGGGLNCLAELETGPLFLR